MPGLFGVVDAARGARAGCAALLDAMAPGGRLIAESVADVDGRWALGRVHLGVLNPGRQGAADDRVQVLFHGDLHNEAALRQKAARFGEPIAPGPAGVVGALYRHVGPAFAAELKGAFSIAMVDHARSECLLVSDRLGSYPLYWFSAAGRLVFASELRAALRLHPEPRLDVRAVADMLNFGFPFGTRTLAEGIELLPAASVLTYRLADGQACIRHYASAADLFRQTTDHRDEYLRDVAHAFSEAMTRTVAGSHRYGLSLSGGLDTRVILSALDRLGVRISTFTLGARGCADEIIATRLSRIARTTHRFVPLDETYLDDLGPPMSRMVSVTDGMYVSHGFTEVLALQALEESDVSVLIRGHGGELAKASTAWPFHTDALVRASNGTEAFIEHLLERQRREGRGESAHEVLTTPWKEKLDGGGARRSLEDAVTGVPLSPADLCSYLYLTEYFRRVAVPSLEIFRRAAEVRLPLADIDFLAAVLRGPAAWRDDTAIHRALVGTGRPAFSRVRNPNTGAPAGAGPWLEAALDKVNTVLRRINAYGYRHYHSFDGWMRRALLDTVDRVLLAPETIARGIFREDVIRQRVSAARQGGREHDELLQALVVVELWQRENLDRSRAA